MHIKRDRRAGRTGHIHLLFSTFRAEQEPGSHCRHYEIDARESRDQTGIEAEKTAYGLYGKP
jgi:hypothetical protein